MGLFWETSSTHKARRLMSSRWMNQSYTAGWVFITHTFISYESLTLILKSDQLHCFKRKFSQKWKCSYLSLVPNPFPPCNTKGHILRDLLITHSFRNETSPSSVRFDIKNDWFSRVSWHHACQIWLWNMVKGIAYASALRILKVLILYLQIILLMK